MTQEIGIASGRARNLLRLLTVFPFKLGTALVCHAGSNLPAGPKARIFRLTRPVFCLIVHVHDYRARARSKKASPVLGSETRDFSWGGENASFYSGVDSHAGRGSGGNFWPPRKTSHGRGGNRTNS